MFIEVEAPTGVKQTPKSNAAQTNRKTSRMRESQTGRSSNAGSTVGDPDEKTFVQQLQDSLATAEERASDAEKELEILREQLAELEAEKRAQQQRRKMSTRGSVHMSGGGRRGAHEEIEELTEENMRLRKELADARGEVARLEDAGNRAQADAMHARDGELEEALHRVDSLEKVNDEFRHLNNVLRDQLLTVEERAATAEAELERLRSYGPGGGGEGQITTPTQDETAAKFVGRWRSASNAQQAESERKKLVEECKKIQACCRAHAYGAGRLESQYNAPPSWSTAAYC